MMYIIFTTDLTELAVLSSWLGLQNIWELLNDISQLKACHFSMLLDSLG